jgi:undecaprenyl-diphosphatase
MDLTLTAILLGIVEGVTEFIPVSSTGHLILATELFGYDARTWEVFNIVIQLGAILAVVVLYWRTFWAVGWGLLRREPVSWRFLRNLLIAFLPAAVLGVLFKDQIDALLENPMPVGWALMLGGVAILLIERYARPGGPSGIGQLPMKTALGIGLVQCISMVPGVSRSGATIMGALAMGVERRTAAEFSFFLAVPTMLGASTLQMLDHRDELMSGSGPVGWTQIAIGFVVAFVVALVVIRAFVAYVSRAGFAPFAWYRLVAGALAVAWLSLR